MFIEAISLSRLQGPAAGGEISRGIDAGPVGLKGRTKPNAWDDKADSGCSEIMPEKFIHYRASFSLVFCYLIF